MSPETLNFPKLTNAEAAAGAIKCRLVDLDKRSGLIAVNNDLEVVTIRTFDHELSLSTLVKALDDVVKAKGTGVVVFNVVDPRGKSVPLHSSLIQRLEGCCDAVGITLLDILSYLPQGCRSARRTNLL